MEDKQPEIRPFPEPPRCRGIPLRDGNYSGCAFGYGDVPPFTGPCDCPTCEGSGIEPTYTTLPHSDFGDPECCGCLYGVIRPDGAAILCNECAAVVRYVPKEALRQVLDEMEISLDVATEKCPHCGSINLLPGFSRMRAFTCRECGKSVCLT